MPMPFDGKLFTFTNPDGSEVQVRGYGDQHYAVFETLDGFTVVRDEATGYYQYAQLSEDKSRLQPCGVNVGEADPESLGLPRNTRIRREAARKQAESARSLSGPHSRWETRRAEKKSDSQLTGVAPGERSPPPAAWSSGATTRASSRSTPRRVTSSGMPRRADESSPRR